MEAPVHSGVPEGLLHVQKCTCHVMGVSSRRLMSKMLLDTQHMLALGQMESGGLQQSQSSSRTTKSSNPQGMEKGEKGRQEKKKRWRRRNGDWYHDALFHSCYIRETFIWSLVSISSRLLALARVREPSFSSSQVWWWRGNFSCMTLTMRTREMGGKREKYIVCFCTCTQNHTGPFLIVYTHTQCAQKQTGKGPTSTTFPLSLNGLLMESNERPYTRHICQVYTGFLSENGLLWDGKTDRSETSTGQQPLPTLHVLWSFGGFALRK